MLRVLNSMKSQREAERQTRRYRELMRKFAHKGGELFGPVPDGVRREFFCLDDHTWVWHEEWTDEKGEKHIITTRYDIKRNGVLKAQDGQPYRYVEGEEAKRLYKAARMYNYLVQTELRAK